MDSFDAQAAFEQVIQRFDALQSSQNEMKDVLIQTVDIQTAMLGTQNQMLGSLQQLQSTQNQMLETQNRMLQDIQQLQGSQVKLLRVQNDMLNYMKFTFDQQAKWNERQDQFNIIFLDELREVKGDVRNLKNDVRELKDDVHEIKKKITGELEARLIRLEDFMNDQLRKAS